MTVNQLIGECWARQCVENGNTCPFDKECALFESIYGRLPFEIRNLSERERQAIILRIKENLEKEGKKNETQV